jgi:hypothetical protein
MNRIVAVPIDTELASLIGKRGSETSMLLFNRKVGDDIIIVLAPSDIEGKFYALPNSMILAEQIIISTANIDALFGEIVVAASLLDKRVIFTTESDVSGLVSGIDLPGKLFVERDEIINAINSYPVKQKEGPVKVEVDRSFNVKGTGTVLLGFVTRGTLKKHDILYTRSGKELTVRSIQCQDEDVGEAETGARVGIAAKGIDEDDVRKGDVLSTSKIPLKNSIEIDVRESRLAHEEMKAGNQYQIFSSLDSGSCVIGSISRASIELKLDKEFQLEQNDTVMLGRKKQPRIFASGVVR